MKRCILYTAFISFILFSLPLYASVDVSKGEAGEEGINTDTPPVIIKSVEPSYPVELIGKYQEGRVVLSFIVNSEGVAVDIKVLESMPSGVFDEYAISAMKEYRFKPATSNGQPVACAAKLPVEFSLSEKGTGEEVITGYDAYKEAEAGLKYIGRGEYDLAIEAFSNAIKIYDRYAAAFCGRGIAYIEKGDYPKAMSDLNEAIRLEPDIARYYNIRGRLYAILKDYQKAIDDFTEAVRLDKDMIDAYFYRGEAYRQSGRYSEAVQDYSRVIELDKSNVQAYNNRGYSYSKLKDIENTCADLKKACELGDCRGFDIMHKAGKCVAGKSSNP